MSGGCRRRRRCEDVDEGAVAGPERVWMDGGYDRNVVILAS